MDIARSVAALLTWQWLILILALTFRRPLRELFSRIVRIGIGGAKGAEIFAPWRDPEPDIGRVLEVGEPEIKDRIDARLIVLRDKEDRERAILGVTDKGAVSFTMRESNGSTRTELIAYRTASSLWLYGSDDNRGVWLTSGRGRSALRLESGDVETGLANLRIAVEGQKASVEIKDAQGRRNLAMPAG
jgi:hypothetical protein